MAWKTIAAGTTADLLDSLEELFWQTGAVSVTVVDAEDNPIFEPGPGEIPVWDKVTVTGLFEENVDVDLVRNCLNDQAFKFLYVEVLGDRVWEREWLSRFKPMLFGERLWVCPTGYEVTESDAVVMDLDPGLAFGTGTHATTKMCLEWLDGNVKPGIKVMDFGSGSGILGVAALLLGAESVIAVDNDHQALTASKDNAVRNKVQDRLLTFMPGQYPDQQFDLVIANILAQPLIDLSGLLSDLLKPGGDLVLSGIMEGQSESVKKAYKLEFLREEKFDGWVCLHARKS